MWHGKDSPSSVFEGVDEQYILQPGYDDCPTTNTSLYEMGFLYSVFVRNLSGSGIPKVSRKGMDPSDLVSSTMNCIIESLKFMCSKNLSIWCFVAYKFVICIYSVYSRWILNCVYGLDLKVLHVEVGHHRIYRWPHGSSYQNFNRTASNNKSI